MFPAGDAPSHGGTVRVTVRRARRQRQPTPCQASDRGPDEVSRPGLASAPVSTRDRAGGTAADPLVGPASDPFSGFYPTVTEVLALPAVVDGEPVVRAGASAPRPAGALDPRRRGRRRRPAAARRRAAPDHRRAAAPGARRARGVRRGPGRRRRHRPHGRGRAAASTGCPTAMVEVAERRGLVLVELAREVRFAAITEQVHARIVDAQLAELRLSDEVHAAFTELTVEGAPPTEIVRQVARMAGRPVVLENLAHQVLAVDAAGRDLAVGARRVGGPQPRGAGARAHGLRRRERLAAHHRRRARPGLGPSGAAHRRLPQRRATRCCSSAAPRRSRSRASSSATASRSSARATAPCSPG